MLHFFAFLFIIVLAILLVGLAIIGSVFRKLFGLGRGRTSSGSYRYGKDASDESPSFNTDHSSSQSRQKQAEKQDAPTKHKKLFTKDDGEYIDFEEIKEE